jgi:hypothetical protein
LRPEPAHPNHAHAKVCVVRPRTPRTGIALSLLDRTIALMAALTLANVAVAADTLCPGAVDVKQAGAAPSSQWSVSYSALPNELEMVTFFSGPPKDEASLAYDDIVNSRRASIATWTFPKESRAYWVRCSYRGTSLELSKALSMNVASCRVTYDRQASSTAGLPAIKAIACQ